MGENAHGTLDGFIDHADWHGMRGWAFDQATPDEAQWLEVHIDDAPPITFLANMRRQDLVEAGYGTGMFGFELRFPVTLNPRAPHEISVYRRRDLVPLPNSPIRLTAAPMGSPERRREFEDMLQAEITATVEGAEMDDTISYLLRQVDTLLDGRAGLESGAAALQQFRLRWNDYLDGHRARPLQPDARPWALIVATELPDSLAQVGVLQAMQALGFRLAVVAQRDMIGDGPVAASLRAMGIQVIGVPEYYSLEDVLRRNRGLYRAVVLWGTLIAASYAVLARMMQPKARIISVLGDLAVERIEPAMLVSAAILNDLLLVENEASRDHVAQRLPGKAAILIDSEAELIDFQALLEPLLPKLRINRPSDSPDPA